LNDIADLVQVKVANETFQTQNEQLTEKVFRLQKLLEEAERSLKMQGQVSEETLNETV
jgi:hypothetical protein